MPCQAPGAASVAVVLLLLTLLSGSSTPAAAGAAGVAGFEDIPSAATRPWALEDILTMPPEVCLRA